MMTAKPLYGQNVLISQITNRPVDPNDQTSQLKIPTFHCTLCDNELNTPTQAIQHFSGKTHAAMLEKVNSKSDDKKKGNFTSQSNSNEPNNIQKDVPQNKSKHDGELICQTCDMMFNSHTSAQQHFTGKKHALNVAAKSTSSYSKIEPTGSQKDSTNHCNLCDISLTSVVQLQQHYNGVRHKLKAGIVKDPPDWWQEQQNNFNKVTTKPCDSKGVQEAFKCDTCQVLLNSQIQLGQHLSSQKHQEKEKSEKSNTSGFGNKRGRGKTRNGSYQEKSKFEHSQGRGRGRGRGRDNMDTSPYNNTNNMRQQQYNRDNENPNNIPVYTVGRQPFNSGPPERILPPPLPQDSYFMNDTNLSGFQNFVDRF